MERKLLEIVIKNNETNIQVNFTNNLPINYTKIKEYKKIVLARVLTKKIIKKNGKTKLKEK